MPVLLVQLGTQFAEEKKESQRGCLALVDCEEDSAFAGDRSYDTYLGQSKSFGDQYSVFGLSPPPSSLVGAPYDAFVDVEDLIACLQNLDVFLGRHLPLEQGRRLIEALANHT